MAGGTVTVAGGNVIHTFTSSGYLTPIVLVNNSLRFRSSASAYLNRTPTTVGNRKTWTWSAWVKRGSSSFNTLFAARQPAPRQYIAFYNNQIYCYGTSSGSDFVECNTAAVFRDFSAWYNIVFVYDTTQATGSNRVKVYVNGVQQTLTFTTTPSQNSDGAINGNWLHYLGSQDSSTPDLDAYLAEVNFVDGQALTPNSFGTTSDLGVWQPIRYGGSYGTNGFYLKFTDTTSTTTLGYDSSPNGNNWTTNNISLTAGSTYDSMTDVPTNTNSNTANYCVLSPVDTYDNPPTQGNLARIGVGHTGSPWSTCRATLGVSSGKWYFEGTFTGSTGSAGNNMIGVMTTTTSTLSDAYGGSTTRSYQANGNLQGDNSTGTVSSATSGDVIMIAFDVDAGQLWVGKNGTWMNSGVPASGTGNVFTTLPTSPIVPQVSMYGNTGDNYGWFTNFGQQPFAYTPPTGFLQLNTFNLPTPTIGATASTLAGDYFNTVLYTGNGGSQSVTGVGFQPDWVWVKVRSSTQNHSSNDSVRGAGYYLVQNATAAERFQGEFDSFDSDGFSLTFDAGEGDYNGSGKTYVAWNWRANQGTNVSNTDGTITSTVSANTTAGFSIVTYTGTGADATVGHGLSAVPSMYIVKKRSAAGDNWCTYHISLGNTNFIRLDTTNAVTTFNLWQDTTPTSSVFYLSSDVGTNGSGATFVAYCFAPIAGYSAFGSYTGNGSTDGPFVFTGFRPRWVMFKQSSSSGAGWLIYDSARNTYNLVDLYLQANQSNAEAGNSTDNPLDFLSNGFKLRYSNSATNQSGATYIYMAFAENPFKYANAR
jgi:hypothetical protein